MNIPNKNCSDCEHYEERTPYNGYCNEWDAIVEAIDSCLANSENTKKDESK